MPETPRHDRGQAVAWALYDWANSAYTLSVMTVFFPVFLGTYWIRDEAVSSTFVLGMANGGASLIIVLSAPILGAIADAAGQRKRYLTAFAFMGIVMCIALGGVAAGNWGLAVALFVTATVGFSGANIFYDSLLVAVADEDRRERVSALGFALGYLGGSLVFILNAAMVMQPHWFGFTDQAQATRWAFVTVGAWWALFTLPLLFRVGEPPALGRGGGGVVRQGLRQLVQTIRHIRSVRAAALFLLAYWFYIDGVDTIVRMAVDYGQQLGLETRDLVLAILVTNLVGFPATLVYGRIAERTGARLAILGGLGIYILITVGAFFVATALHFYVLATAVGLVMGGVQASSRAFFSRLIPPGRMAEFFGFYNMLGKFAAVLGPLMVGWTAAATGSPRLGILTVLVLFVVGGILLWCVPEPGRQAR